MAKLSLQKINGNDSISASRLVINKNFEDISNTINNFENNLEDISNAINNFENNLEDISNAINNFENNELGGIILTAPNGDKYKITVDDDGVLKATKIN